ncbi:hypothetical protein KUCAC02_016549, partial [Chaenocephalus aceratus]
EENMTFVLCAAECLSVSCSSSPCRWTYLGNGCSLLASPGSARDPTQLNVQSMSPGLGLKPLGLL